MELPNVAAMIHRHTTLANITRVDEWNTPRHVIPTVMKWSEEIFPSSRFSLESVISATWVDSSTPLRYGRNDILEGDSVLSTQVILGTWRAAGCRPYGYAGGRYRSTAQVVFETWRAADLYRVVT